LCFGDTKFEGLELLSKASTKDPSEYVDFKEQTSPWYYRGHCSSVEEELLCHISSANISGFRQTKNKPKYYKPNRVDFSTPPPLIIIKEYIITMINIQNIDLNSCGTLRTAGRVHATSSESLYSNIIRRNSSLLHRHQTTKSGDDSSSSLHIAPSTSMRYQCSEPSGSPPEIKYSLQVVA
jgi:hypothetical protein